MNIWTILLKYEIHEISYSCISNPKQYFYVRCQSKFSSTKFSFLYSRKLGQRLWNKNFRKFGQQWPLIETELYITREARRLANDSANDLNNSPDSYVSSDTFSLEEIRSCYYGNGMSQNLASLKEVICFKYTYFMDNNKNAAGAHVIMDFIQTAAPSW